MSLEICTNLISPEDLVMCAIAGYSDVILMRSISCARQTVRIALFHSAQQINNVDVIHS